MSLNTAVTVREIPPKSIFVAQEAHEADQQQDSCYNDSCYNDSDLGRRHS